jgi:hypothetical protein
MDSLENFNVASLPVGEVLKKSSTNSVPSLTNGAILKCESQKIIILELIDKKIKLTVKDSLLDKIEATTELDINNSTELQKIIAEMNLQINNN